jgi:hypothetical protein
MSYNNNNNNDNNNYHPVSIVCFPDHTGQVQSSEDVAYKVLNTINTNSKPLYYNTVGDAEVTTQRAVAPATCGDLSGWSDKDTAITSCASGGNQQATQGMQAGIAIAVILAVLLGVGLGYAWHTKNKKRQVQPLPQPEAGPAAAPDASIV